jgi:hypothetical protein
MIQDKDAELHPAPADDPLWAETNYFGFEVPDVPRWSMNGKTGYGTSTDFYDYSHFPHLFP